MFRRLFTFFAIFSLLACAGMSALSVRSYWVAYGITYHRPSTSQSAGAGRIRYFAVWIGRGQLFCEFLPKSNGKSGWQFEKIEPWDEDAFPATPRFQFALPSYIWIPAWAPLALLAIAPLAKFTTCTRRLRQDRHGLCPTCGYDLRASAGRCPECGTLPTAKVTA
jgi:hypothetical protein